MLKQVQQICLGKANTTKVQLRSSSVNSLFKWPKTYSSTILYTVIMYRNSFPILWCQGAALIPFNALNTVPCTCPITRHKSQDSVTKYLPQRNIRTTYHKESRVVWQRCAVVKALGPLL